MALFGTTPRRQSALRPTLSTMCGSIGIALFIAAVPLFGCGSSVQEPETVASDQRAVAKVLESYEAALRAGRSDRICGELFAKELAETVKSPGGCERFVSEATPRSEELDLTVENVTIDGTTATAEFTATGTVDGAQIPPGGTASAVLVKQEDSWRIIRLP